MVSICGTHDPGSMRSLQSIRAGGIGQSVLAITLAAYLFLFSWAALVHAYAQGELVDAHGCVIGAWVQHASATDPVVPALAPDVVFVNLARPSCDLVRTPSVFVVALRGPPAPRS